MAIFNLNFLLKVGQVEMCQNPSPISTRKEILCHAIRPTCAQLKTDPHGQMASNRITTFAKTNL